MRPAPRAPAGRTWGDGQGNSLRPLQAEPARPNGSAKDGTVDGSRPSTLVLLLDTSVARGRGENSPAGAQTDRSVAQHQCSPRHSSLHPSGARTSRRVHENRGRRPVPGCVLLASPNIQDDDDSFSPWKTSSRSPRSPGANTRAFLVPRLAAGLKMLPPALIVAARHLRTLARRAVRNTACHIAAPTTRSPRGRVERQRALAAGAAAAADSCAQRTGPAGPGLCLARRRRAERRIGAGARPPLRAAERGARGLVRRRAFRQGQGPGGCRGARRWGGGGRFGRRRRAACGGARGSGRCHGRGRKEAGGRARNGGGSSRGAERCRTDGAAAAARAGRGAGGARGGGREAEQDASVARPRAASPRARGWWRGGRGGRGRVRQGASGAAGGAGARSGGAPGRRAARERPLLARARVGGRGGRRRRGRAANGSKG